MNIALRADLSQTTSVGTLNVGRRVTVAHKWEKIRVREEPGGREVQVLTLLKE